MKVVCISDTHGRHEEITVPDGDVLIHAGDFTKFSTMQEVIRFNAWLGKLPHVHKILVPGNHDFLYQDNPSLALVITSNATILIDQVVQILHGGKEWSIYGSPWTSRFRNWAFMQDGENKLAEIFNKIPIVDILVTHSPPFGKFDKSMGKNLGSEALRDTVRRVKPKLHVFGHIHNHGQMGQRTISVNASICDDMNRVQYEPTVVDL